MKLDKILNFIVLISFVGIRADQIQFDGPVPPDVDKAAMTAEYYRLYKVLAPRQRPDVHPVRIVYLAGKESATRDYGLPEWGGGGAIGRDLIVIPTAARPFLDLSFGQITRHELVHIVLNRAYPSCAIPRWFHEGVAMTLSGELSFEENVIVSRAIFTNSLLPLLSIDSVNGFGRSRADLAYCQSHLSVLFLIDQYSIGVLCEILVSARKTSGFWQGVNAVLSITPQEFEQAARAYVTTRYKLVFLISDYPAFWVAIVFLFLVASGVAIVRKRRKLGSMERAEQEEAESGLRRGDAPAPAPPHAEADAEMPAGGDKSGNNVGGGGNYDEYEDVEFDEDDDDGILGDGIELEDDDDDQPPDAQAR